MMQQMLVAGGLQNPTATYIGGATGTNTATLPVHAVGDLIVCWAFRDGAGANPSLGAGFTSGGGVADGSTCSATIGYRIATVTNTAAGTWTNASAVAFVIYRNATLGTVGSGTSFSVANANAAYPPLTPSVPNGSSLVLGVIGYTTGDTNIQTAPTGMVNRQNVAHASDEVSIHETTAGCYLWAQQTVAFGGTPGTGVATTLEIKSA